MKRVFETAECEEVRSYMFLCTLRYEKHESQMKGCAGRWMLGRWTVDLVGLWCCKRSARYGGWLVCSLML